jgi:hypothetical protein
MTTGGSAGLRMTMALPRWAPPTCCSAREVVVVNSSMFARVPGPAARLARLATISAYGTSVTDDSAATIGTVACPPHVTMFTLGAERTSSRFTAGTTKGPTIAGVRSMATRPASA